ncbi:hypothetical protein DN062_17265 [Nitrincola tibetensis]|uniref:Glycerophosphoryl diester phosphodiesterase membrane domain-containing protein n=1 Tax=Nitrincola tibetensis TaxID=2219697 RepID=A0A364NHK2_9GAMM|nr:hypothetical protein [Nitrincola tibetensis]RAU16599.1 hypothetical protein DN062_17265 [Nitrincola tibetensis]
MTLEYLRQALFFFKSHLMALAAIQLPFLLILALLKFSATGQLSDEMDTLPSSFLLIGLLELALLPLYWGATIFYMKSVLDGNPLPTLQAISLGISSWGRLLITYLLNGLAVMAGLIMLIIPGVFVGVRLSFADYICVLEGKTASTSLKQSWGQSKEFFWTLLQGYLLIFVSLLLMQMLIENIVGSSGISILLSLVIDFCSILITIFGFRLYTLSQDKV